MIAEFRPSRAEGIMTAPPSKSMAHRLILCAGLSEGISRVENVDLSEDVLATMDCLRALGARVRIEERSDSGEKDACSGIVTAVVTGIGEQKAGTAVPESIPVLPCRECGSTLRFFIPLCLVRPGRSRLTGSTRLMERPLRVYEDLCREQGLVFLKDKDAVELEGTLSPGLFELPGSISSQFISGLLFALPLLQGDSRIRIIPPIESRPYILMTMQSLEIFGVKAVWKDENTIELSGGQRYLPRSVRVEGDYSNAAFFDGFNLTGGSVSVEGLKEESLQGDKKYRQYFEMLREGFTRIDLSECPDLGPVLIAAATLFEGALFTGAGRLKIKESDRGAAMAEELRKMGNIVELSGDEIRVRPGIRQPEEILDGHNDHRIVMALSLLLSKVGGSIRDAQAVRKSLPDYFDRIRALGIDVSLRS